MNTFSIGDKIKSLSKKTFHIVESIETIENKTIIFTEDVKCFPMEDIEQHYDSFISEYFLKIFSGKCPTDEEVTKFKNILSKSFK